jgi:hypothetical protein
MIRPSARSHQLATLGTANCRARRRRRLDRDSNFGVQRDRACNLRDRVLDLCLGGRGLRKQKLASNPQIKNRQIRNSQQ